MNSTNTVQDSVRFAVIASCMTPRGAWARSLGGNGSESFCRHQFNLAGFSRPETGIMWGQTLSLVKVTTRRNAAGEHETTRETLATRSA